MFELLVLLRWSVNSSPMTFEVCLLYWWQDCKSSDHWPFARRMNVFVPRSLFVCDPKFRWAHRLAPSRAIQWQNLWLSPKQYLCQTKKNSKRKMASFSKQIEIWFARKSTKIDCINDNTNIFLRDILCYGAESDDVLLIDRGWHHMQFSRTVDNAQ